MYSFFNKHFFKVLLGFLWIMAFSFIVLFVVGYYESSLEENSRPASLGDGIK